MTKDELAAMLNGRPYGEEITEDEVLAAKASGLVVVFGYDDNSIQFRGAIDEDIACSDDDSQFLEEYKILIAGGKIWGCGDGSCDAGDYDCECPHHARAKEDAQDSGKTIMAVWREHDAPDRTYVTEIPHATFNVLTEDGEVYCRGIVFSLADVA